MKKAILRVVVLVLVFCLGVFALTRVHKEESTTVTESMSSATLPVLSLNSQSITLNQLHGYTTDMEAATLRQTLTPLSDDRKLGVQIATYGAKVTGVSYEVRSLDSSRLVEQTKVEDTQDKDGTISATLNLKNLMDENQEYLLKIILQTDTQEAIYYYTRIVHSTNLYMTEKVNFVTQFHNNTFVKNNNNDIINYLEPNSSGDNSTFQKVNIHSNLAQVTWGNLAVTVESEVVPEILEMDSSTASIKIDYMVSAKDDAGEKEYYTVSEYYRIRYTTDRIYLLDFERTMNQYFIPSDTTISGTKITLGIQENSTNYLENEEADKLCFTDNLELWAYNSTAHTMSKVFSFINDDYTDLRDTYNQHAIKLIDMDDQGNIDFMVYGYMNRGRHEGQVGVSVYYYDAATNTIEEKVFIPSTESYQVLKESIGKFSYVNASNTLYTMLNGTMYSINLTDCTYKEIMTDLEESAYVVSQDNKLFAWQNSNTAAEVTKITIMNLDTNATNDISVGDDKRIKSIGFMGTDFIYGEANVSDITTDVAGATVFPMGTIHIVDQTMKELKQYQNDNIYTVDAKIDENMIHLTRVTKTDAGYESIDSDDIINNQAEVKSLVATNTIVTDLKETQMQLVLPSEAKKGSLKVLRPKEVVFPNNRSVDLYHKNKDKSYFYMYAKGELEGIYTEANQAVQAAETLTGVVVDQDQNYIWQRGNRKIRTQIDSVKETKAMSGSTLATCMNVLLTTQNVSIGSENLLENGQSVTSIIQNNLNKTALDLNGCSLSAVLYYVSKGAPVIAKIDDTNFVLIIGYDEFNTIVMNPATGTIYKIGMNDGAQLFESAGNVFISFIP